MTKKLTVPNNDTPLADGTIPENQDATPPENNPDAPAQDNDTETDIEKAGVVTTATFPISPEEKITSNWGITVHPDDDTLILAVSDLTSRCFEGTREEFSKLLREG